MGCGRGRSPSWPITIRWATTSWTSTPARNRRPRGPRRRPRQSPRPSKYRVNTEPFVPTQVGVVGSFGVGRIPLQSLADASVLFARGLLQGAAGRQPPARRADGEQFRSARPLPLCETISRVTAEEYKNCRVPVDEFYGKLADSPGGPGGGQDGGTDHLRGAPGVSRPLRRAVGPPRHGPGQLF